MIPSIWKKINWKFVFYLLLGVILGTPIGINLLSILDPKFAHLIIASTVLIFAILLLKGYKNTKLNHNVSKFFVGSVAGLPIALYFLIISAEPAVIRASLAALFFFTDFYALILAYFKDILNLTVIYRTLPLILVVPIGVALGTKLFTDSSKESYKKYVLYFLIIISIFGFIKVFS